MNKSILIVSLFLSAPCYGSNGNITKIINQAAQGMNVSIYTSDQAGSVVLKTGQKLSGADGVKGKGIDVNSISSLIYTIPWENWDKGIDNRAAIIIWSRRGLQVVGKSVFYENDKTIHIEQYLNGALVKKLDIPKTIGDVNLTVLVQPDGLIMVPDMLNIRFQNNTGVPILVGSPDCSIEQDLDKQFQKVTPGQFATIPLLRGKSKCKIVAQDGANPQRQAYMCLNENGEETNCAAADCPADPITGVSVCDNFGVVWTRGTPQKRNAVTTEIPYGLIRRVNYDEAVKQLIYGTPSDQDIKDTPLGFLVGSVTWALEYGKNPATDFPDLIVKAGKIMAATNNNAMFLNSFCCVVKKDPLMKSKMQQLPQNNFSLNQFNTICRGKC